MRFFTPVLISQTVPRVSNNENINAMTTGLGTGILTYTYDVLFYTVNIRQKAIRVSRLFSVVRLTITTNLVVFGLYT